MNKSKFLKKSLAMLLAIMMVVAMIPLSAAAEDAPTDPAPTIEPPTVTVNNRTATKPADGSNEYNVTVQDATTVSIAWVPVEGYTAQVVTARDVTIQVPFSGLDLLNEATVISEKDVTPVVYQVTFQVLNADKEVVGDYKLNITSVVTVANDDTTLQAVRPNQQFRNGTTDYAFIGIKGEFDNVNETVTITLPLGMTWKEAGFGDGTNGSFGAAQTLSDADGILAEGEPIAGTDDENNRIARRVFIPNSVYSTVNYQAPTSVTGNGRLTVTARDGHTRNYTVKFVQENALTDVAVKVGKNTYNTYKTTTDTSGTTTYNVVVNNKTDFTAIGAGFSTILFNHDANVVRVEDPHFQNSTLPGSETNAGWDSILSANKNESKDYPIKSGENQVRFEGGSGTPPTYVYYLTVKTEANMEPNAPADINNCFYKNVKIIVSEASTVAADDTAPLLRELQINGYDSQVSWTEDGLNDEINYYVDYQFQFSTGDGQHPARISATTNSGNYISIPAQDPSIVGDRYWGVKKTQANGNRFNKPNAASAVIDNVNTEGGSFVLRVFGSDGKTYKDYTINLIKPSQDTGTTPTRVTLKYFDGKEKVWKTLESTKADTHRNFNFDLDASWYENFSEAVDASATDASVENLDLEAGATMGTYQWQETDDANPTDPAEDVGTPEDITVTMAAVDTDDLPKLAAAIKAGMGDTAAAVAADNVELYIKKNATKLDLIAKVSTDAGTKDIVLASATAAVVSATAGQENQGTITFDVDGASVVLDFSVAKATATAGHTLVNPAMSDVFTAIANACTTENKVATGDYDPEGGDAHPAVEEKYTLNSLLKSAYILIDTPLGSVVTPGGSLNGRTTQEVGISLWGVGDGYNKTWPNVDQYKELEEGVTKVSDWFVPNYVIGFDGKAVKPVTANNYNAADSKLYFSVKNGREGIKQAYTITFSRRGTGDETPAKAELSVSKATSGVEEDLVYAGNTASNGVIVQNSNNVPATPAYPTATNSWSGWTGATGTNSNVNPGFIDPANAAYIGAMNNHNTYGVEIAPLANSAKEYVITVTVPEDFRANDDTTNPLFKAGDGIIYFTDFEMSDLYGGVFRGDANNASAPSAVYPYVPAGATSHAVANLNISMVDQTQQNTATKQFKIKKSDMTAWNGDLFDPTAVSSDNVLYVYDNEAVQKTAPTNSADAYRDATAIYYVTVKKAAFATGDAISGVGSSDTKVRAIVNQATKTVTVNVPASYNTIGYHTDNDPVFDLNFNTSNGALLIDAAQDTAIEYLRAVSPAAASFKNFTLPDLIKREQEVDKWVSAGIEGATSTKFFVKDGELYVDNEFTGTETQITGLADSAFINNQWGVQEARQSELHVYSEGRNNVNNYKLELVIREESSEATITHLLVDETTAELDPENDKLFTVALPQGTNPEAVKLSIAVSEGAEVESVNGAPFDPNDTEKTYDITKPITIIIVAEDGTPYTYTLSMDGSVPTPSPTPSEEPSPSPTPDFDASKYADLDKLSESVRAEVIAAMKAGLVQGIKTDAEPYEFGVGMSMRRYQMALLIARADLKKAGETGDAAELDAILVEKYGTETPFTDLGNRADAAKAAIAYCLDKGYMKGVSDTEFNPNGNLSRQEAAVAMARVAGLSDENKDVSMFKDGDKIANWAKGYVRAAYDAGLVNGLDNGNFGPTQNILRQHAVCLFTRAFLDEDGNIKDPDDGDEPSNPDDGDEPSNPDEGDEPSNPDEGSEPSNPDEGSEPSNPDEGGDTSEPSTPDEGGDTSEPTE
ncbi:S-layer homology domain-containing protein [Acutalibacter intestini]|uniref:S-layer homology domain-containing protein n=1 Tax=Acutalibacter intestini TaxID=3093659 RepID=UPI002AC97B6D|nr:S-layer homology domain-containing protein [Acutalibacter sp. M00204]